MSQSILHNIVENATNLAPNTKVKYLRDLNAWIAYASVDPNTWTRRTAQNFYAGLLQRMKPQSANRLMASVQFAAKWWALQEDNPALNFATVQTQGAGAKADKMALSEAQARALLLTAKSASPIDLRDFALMVVGLETGMRRMSMQSMTFEQTFFAGDAKLGYPTARVLMKGRRQDRVAVPLSDTAIEALRPWVAWLASHGNELASHGVPRGPIFRGLAKRIAPGGLTMHAPGKTALSESAIHKIISERGEAGGIDISPHVFRHTFITWRMDAGFSAHEVAAVTAHKLRELGALGEYIQPAAIGAKMRLATPAWLVELVRTRA